MTKKGTVIDTVVDTENQQQKERQRAHREMIFSVSRKRILLSAPLGQFPNSQPFENLQTLTQPCITPLPIRSSLPLKQRQTGRKKGENSTDVNAVKTRCHSEKHYNPVGTTKAHLSPISPSFPLSILQFPRNFLTRAQSSFSTLFPPPNKQTPLPSSCAIARYTTLAINRSPPLFHSLLLTLLP